jgi:hypothetical protein
MPISTQQMSSSEDFKRILEMARKLTPSQKTALILILQNDGVQYA